MMVRAFQGCESVTRAKIRVGEGNGERLPFFFFIILLFFYFFIKPDRSSEPEETSGQALL